MASVNQTNLADIKTNLWGELKEERMDEARACVYQVGLRQTIKLTDRQAEMVLAMFVGNEEDGRYTGDAIREWQWGVGRSLLKAIGPHESRSLTLEAAE
jgi:hypothetical protein